jgi:AhpD family alkylhydroperoxidase
MTKRLDYNQVAPNGAKVLGGVYGYVMQSGLPAGLIDLVYLRVSQINNCAYCLDMHTRDLIKKGVKIEKLALVQAWAEAGHLFSERERAALAWAETVTRVSETGVPDEAFQAARAVFEEKGTGRSHDRDQPDECLQPVGDRLPEHAKGSARKLRGRALASEREQSRSSL